MMGRLYAASPARRPALVEARSVSSSRALFRSSKESRRRCRHRGRRHHRRRRGVALLEGRRIGRGSTAASTALLMQEPDEDLAVLTRQYGRRRAQRIWQLSREASHEFVETLTDLDCDLRRRDSVYYAMTANDARRLRTEHRLRTAAGVRGCGSKALPCNARSASARRRASGRAATRRWSRTRRAWD